MARNEKALTVDVLITNQRAIAFWRSVGYTDYCLTLEMLPNSELVPEIRTTG